MFASLLAGLEVSSTLYGLASAKKPGSLRNPEEEEENGPTNCLLLGFCNFLNHLG